MENRNIIIEGEAAKQLAAIEEAQRKRCAEVAAAWRKANARANRTAQRLDF